MYIKWSVNIYRKTYYRLDLRCIQSHKLWPSIKEQDLAISCQQSCLSGIQLAQCYVPKYIMVASESLCGGTTL